MKKLVLATHIEQYNCRAGICFLNAVQVWLAELQDKGALYVEGYLVDPGFGIFPHGWIELDDVIMEVTPGCEEYAVETYFAAIRYRTIDDLGDSIPSADLASLERFGKIMGDAAVYHWEQLVGDCPPLVEAAIRAGPIVRKVHRIIAR